MPKNLKRRADKDPDEPPLWEPIVKKIKATIAAEASGSSKSTSSSGLSSIGRDNEGRRKWPRQKEPIKNIEDVPMEWDWDPNDLDVDPFDIDANIKRCEERIKDGIMPQIFEKRLSTYTMLKANRNQMITSEKKGLSVDVVRRLDSLKMIEKELIDKGDTWESLPNVRAIMKAYRSRKLEWSKDGKATYWFQGKQICEPKAWDYHDIVKVNRENNGSKGFWVEGIDGPRPGGHFFTWTINPKPDKLTFQHYVRFEVRVPSSMPGNPEPSWRSWKADFFDYTGCDSVTIFQDDLEQIMNLAPSGLNIPFIGNYPMQTANGPIMAHMNVVMQVRMLSPGAYPITKWYPVRVTVHPQRHREFMPVRLSGNWWRYVLYTANAPGNKGLRDIPGSGGEGSQGRTQNTTIPESILQGGNYVPHLGIVGGRNPTAKRLAWGLDGAGDMPSPPPHPPGPFLPGGAEPWGAPPVRPGHAPHTQRPETAPPIPPGLGGWWLPSRLLDSPSPPESVGGWWLPSRLLDSPSAPESMRAAPDPGPFQMSAQPPEPWEYWNPNGMMEGQVFRTTQPYVGFRWESQYQPGWFWVPPGQGWLPGWYYRYSEGYGAPGGVHGGLNPTVAPYQPREEYQEGPYPSQQLHTQATTVRERTVRRSGETQRMDTIPETSEGGSTGITPHMRLIELDDSEEPAARDRVTEGISEPAELPEWPTPVEVSQAERRAHGRRFSERLRHLAKERKARKPRNPSS